ncbi:MAG: excinuclease ABC subunit UvrA [Bacteroidetes bacterium]|nr:excinuclease ABC subunit UvrA [Bacteroidota bacterium]
MQEEKYIEIIGAKLHNLKNINVKIPRNKFVVVTGVSGSGKSSLVFDTLFAEGQRRYVESLSSYARQFLGRLEKPEVDYINGLTPSIAIEQKVNTRNPRSTVATSTEIYEYLKLLFARAGHTFSPLSNKEVKCFEVNDVVKFINSQPLNSHIYITVKLNQNKDAISKIKTLMQNGFTRLLINDEVIKIEDFLKSEKNIQKNTYLIIDRLIYDSNDAGFDNRLADSVQTAFYEGKGEIWVLIKNNEENSWNSFSNRFEKDGIKFEKPSVNLLSFNNPYGACKRCEGFGSVIGIDEDLVIPDKNLSLYEGAVAPWRSEGMTEWKINFLNTSIDKNFPIHRSYNLLNEQEKDILWNGDEKIKGINVFFKSIEEQSYKIQYRVMLSKYRGKTICPDCRGVRLRKDAAYIKLLHTNKLKGNYNFGNNFASISDILLMPVAVAFKYFEELKLNSNDEKIASRLLIEIKNRLKFLLDVGLGYLSLNRLSNSLSGGESQRINLATSLGSSLVGSTYILDEPSIGLHPRDTEKLIDVLKNLKKLGNSVIIVEHDEEIMSSSEHIIDIGPMAGSNGGNIVYEGNFKNIYQSDSLTAKYLSGKMKIETPLHRRNWSNFIKLGKCNLNNLKNIDVTFPLNVITCVTGVSGSGKTSLVKGILYPALQKINGNFTNIRTGKFDNISGDIKLIKQIELIDQNPIGKSTRSNPVTYVKAWDSIRELFADMPLSKRNGLKSQHFSFNVDGGRCEQCKGEGEETVEMQFMADIHLTCDICKGKRFKDEVLEILYKGKNIYDILCLTVDEAIEFFNENKNISNKLKPLQEVGLGYVKLGQSSATLSGGEAQRVKLASFLTSGKNHEPVLFIFDEPTTGLHFNDIEKLVKSFNSLITNGHTVIIIEHNLEVIKCADWVIDIGPEGGENGGKIIYEGTPEGLILNPNSYTAKYLKPKLN